MFNIDLPSWTVNAITDSPVKEEFTRVRPGQTKTRNNPTLNKGNYVVFYQFSSCFTFPFQKER